MSRSSGSRRVGAVILAIALVAVVAAIALGAGAPSTPPSDPSPSPTSLPSPEPTRTPVVPSEPPAGDVVLELDIAAKGPVILVIDDRTGSLVGARSGRASDGMSVRWGEVQVENVDAETLRVTWAGWPRAEEISLVVTEQGDGLLLDFVQGTPPSNSDAMGLDRVVVLEFDRPVRSEDVRATPSSADAP